MKSNLSEIRISLQTLMESMGRKANIPSKKVIAAFRRKHAALIAGLSRELEDLALVKIVADVGARKTRQANPDQPDLFGGYSGIPLTIVTGLGRDMDRKIFERATKKEVTDWLAATKRKPDNHDKRTKGVLHLLDDLAVYLVSDDTTIERAMEAKRADQARANKRKRGAK